MSPPRVSFFPAPISTHDSATAHCNQPNNNRRLLPASALCRLTSQDGDNIAVGSRDGQIRILQTPRRRDENQSSDSNQPFQVTEWEQTRAVLQWHAHWVTGLARLSAERLLSASNDGTCCVWDVNDGDFGFGRRNYVNDDDDNDGDDDVSRHPSLNAPTPELLRTPVAVLRGHSDYVKGVAAFAQDTEGSVERAVSVSLDGSAIMWELGESLPVAQLFRAPARVNLGGGEREPNSLYSVATLGPHQFAAGSSSGEVLLWDVRAGPRPSLTFVGHKDVVRSLALVSSSGSCAGSALPSDIDVAAAAADVRLVTGGADGVVRLWDVRSLRGATCSVSVPSFHSTIRHQLQLKRASFGSLSQPQQPEHEQQPLQQGQADGQQEQLPVLPAVGRDGIWSIDVQWARDGEGYLWTSGRSGLVVRTPLNALLGSEIGPDSGESPGDFELESQSVVVFDVCARRNTKDQSAAPSVLAFAPPKSTEDDSLWVCTSDGKVHLRRVASLDSDFSESALISCTLEPVAATTKATVLPDQRHVLTQDVTTQGVRLWDIQHALEVSLRVLIPRFERKEGDPICVDDYDAILREMRRAIDGSDTDNSAARMSAPPLPWFSIDVILGRPRVTLKFPDCFAAEVYAENAGLTARDTDAYDFLSADRAESGKQNGDETKEGAPERSENSSEWRVNLGQSLLHGLYQHWLFAVSRVASDPKGGDSDSTKAKVEIRRPAKKRVVRFWVPDNDGDTGAPLFLGYTGQLGDAMSLSSSDGAYSSRIGGDLSGGAVPAWTAECLIRGAVPDIPSAAIIPFSLVRLNAARHDKPVALNGQRLLRIGRVQKHAREKIFDRQDMRQAREDATAMADASDMLGALDLVTSSDPKIEITVTCERVPLPPEMELAVVKQRYWKRSGELVLHWSWRVLPLEEWRS